MCLGSRSYHVSVENEDIEGAEEIVERPDYVLLEYQELFDDAVEYLNLHRPTCIDEACNLYAELLDLFSA